MLELVKILSTLIRATTVSTDRIQKVARSQSKEENVW